MNYSLHPGSGSSPRSQRRQRGVTMIEALVTLAIFSFGLLGAAGLMLSGISRSNVANMRSIATMQANEMVDRMRANGDGVRTNKYGTASYTAAGPTTTCSTACETGTCSAEGIANYDACMWNTRNYKLLPSGRGVLQETVTGGAVHTFDIAVCWDENKSADTTCATDDTNDMTRLLIQGVRP